MTKGFHSILLVGCPGCPNESLAYFKNIPLTKEITVNKNQTKIEHCAINQETRKISKKLQDQGLSIKIEIIDEKYLCLLSENDCKILSDRLPHSDAIFVLGCPAAAEGMGRIIGSSSRILLGMKSLALFFYRYIYHSDTGTTYITEAQFAKF